MIKQEAERIIKKWPSYMLKPEQVLERSNFLRDRNVNVRRKHPIIRKLEAKTARMLKPFNKLLCSKTSPKTHPEYYKMSHKFDALTSKVDKFFIEEEKKHPTPKRIKSYLRTPPIWQSQIDRRKTREKKDLFKFMLSRRNYNYNCLVSAKTLYKYCKQKGYDIYSGKLTGYGTWFEIKKSKKVLMGGIIKNAKITHWWLHYGVRSA